MAVNRSSANQKAKFQAEMQAYANSKGVTIPSNLINLYGMMPAGYAASNEIDARSYYTGIAQGRPSFKTPQWAVDNYTKDKPAFYTLVLKDVADTYWGGGANRSNEFLQNYVKLAAENGVPASAAVNIITQAGNNYNSTIAAYNAKNSSNGFANIGPFNLTSVGNTLNSAFGGLGTLVENAYKGVSNTLAKAEDVVKKEVLPNPIFQIAMAYYMPGLVAQFGPSLGALGITSAAAQTAVANAIASTAIQVAQGVPFDKAFQSSVTNAVIASGSPAIAQDINKVIQNPAVTDAIVSAGASAAKTAASGGSKADIERNLVAGLVGSGTATATGSSVAGSAAGGAVTGGVTGALTGAATKYAAELAAEELAKENAAKKASGTSADPGIKVAGGDDATALNMASISAKPEMLGKSGETASALTSAVIDGETVYVREITGKTPDGKSYSYQAIYDPVDKQTSYQLWNSSSNTLTVRVTRPEFSSEGEGVGGVYKPTIITTPNIVTTTGTTSGTSGTGGTGGTSTVSTGGAGGTATTTTGRTEDQPILDLISTTPPTTGDITGGTADGTTGGVTGGTNNDQVIIDLIPGGTPTGGTVTGGGTGGTSTNVGTGAGSSGTITDARGGDGTVGTGTGSGTSGSGTGAGDGSGVGTGTGGTGTGTGGEGDGIGDGEEEPIAKEPTADDKGKPYRPNLFIYGGTKPSTLSRTLGTTVQNVPSASTTTGTSVGLGGRGEIESKESGKKRQTVWNEESLRLKDALGL